MPDQTPLEVETPQQNNMSGVVVQPSSPPQMTVVEPMTPPQRTGNVSVPSMEDGERSPLVLTPVPRRDAGGLEFSPRPIATPIPTSQPTALLSVSRIQQAVDHLRQLLNGANGQSPAMLAADIAVLQQAQGANIQMGNGKLASLLQDIEKALADINQWHMQLQWLRVPDSFETPASPTA